MGRETIEKVILVRAKSVTHFIDNRWRWKDIKRALKEDKITLQDDDILSVGYTEGWQEGSSSRESMYDLKITRPELESEKSFNKRVEREKAFKVKAKEMRYSRYLVLKKEFDE